MKKKARLIPQLGTRVHKFTLLLSQEERAQLHELAEFEGEPASVYLRGLIREKHKGT